MPDLQVNNQFDFFKNIRLDGDGNLLVKIINGGTSGSGLTESFETINNNLKDYPYTISYAGNDITNIVYNLGGGLEITKTFNYTGNKLTSIVLSGDTPVGLLYLTKTFTYTGNNITSVVYS
jgi:hypothetical protein